MKDSDVEKDLSGDTKSAPESSPSEPRYNGIHWCRDFKMNALPRDANGEVMYRGSSPEEYRSYVAWLADHLYETSIPANHNQSDLCRYVESVEREWAMFGLGEGAFYHEDENLDIVIAIYDVLDLSSIFKEQDIDLVRAEVINRLEPDDSLEPEEREEEYERYPLNLMLSADPGPARDLIRQFIFEERERKLYCQGDDLDFGDLGWRIPLATVLKKVKDKKERIRLLDNFFESKPKNS